MASSHEEAEQAERMRENIFLFSLFPPRLYNPPAPPAACLSFKPAVLMPLL